MFFQNFFILRCQNFGIQGFPFFRKPKDVEINKSYHLQDFKNERMLNVAWRDLFNHIVEWIFLSLTNAKMSQKIKQ